MVMICDYYLVRPRLGQHDVSKHQPDTINWAGVISVIAATILAHYVLNRVIPIEFFTSVVTVAILYPVLRLYVLRGPEASTASG